MSNIASIKEWISDKNKKDFTPEYRKSLIRKIQLQLGVTKLKALEYLNLILDE